LLLPGTVFVGRFVYYLSVPLLIALCLEVAESSQVQDLELGPAVMDYLKDLKGKVTAIAGVVSIAVPSLYTLIEKQPLLLNYYDLLELLLAFQKT
jgi:hypothetical protein